jgi:outer membrane protein OmpA-like peptidoglycan-associated protein
MSSPALRTSQHREAGTPAASRQSVRRTAPVHQQGPGPRPLPPLGNQVIQRLLGRHGIQAKLTVNDPGDRFEQEADRVADAVMRTPEASSATPPSIQRTCAHCEEELHRKESTAVQPIQRDVQVVQVNRGGAVQRQCKECEEKARAVGENHEQDQDLMVQTKAVHPERARPAALNSSALDTLKGSGQALSLSTRSFFERRLGHNFGDVRVHTDASADELARSVGARAFTHNSHVVFRAGEYTPGESAGRHLLAHELTHTIQQGASPSVEGHASATETSIGRQPEVPGIQRVCEVTRPPKDLACPEALTSTGSGTPILFGLNNTNLTAAARSTLSAIAAAWHAGGGVSVLRIDGFASCEGAAELNWRLSCDRVLAVKAELAALSDGSPGVPVTHIDGFANGETDQFSATSLPPNRRAVITVGGTPPPGPSCSLTIGGPDEVNHYCAAYVPSDAPQCDEFPAPNITLTVTGAAVGVTPRWSIVRGGASASIVGAINGASVDIQGDAASGSPGDVTVQVTDGTCTNTHVLTVRQPSQMTAEESPTVAPNFVETFVTYTVRDQFGKHMGARICLDETVTLCGTNYDPGSMRFHDKATNPSGQVDDHLLHKHGAGRIPADFCRKFDQTITAGGCGPILHNTILYRSSGITLTHNDSCVKGDPCP